MFSTGPQRAVLHVMFVGLFHLHSCGAPQWFSFVHYVFLIFTTRGHGQSTWGKILIFRYLPPFPVNFPSNSTPPTVCLYMFNHMFPVTWNKTAVEIIWRTQNNLRCEGIDLCFMFRACRVLPVSRSVKLALPAGLDDIWAEGAGLPLSYVWYRVDCDTDPSKYESLLQPDGESDGFLFCSEEKPQFVSFDCFTCAWNGPIRQTQSHLMR